MNWRKFIKKQSAELIDRWNLPVHEKYDHILAQGSENLAFWEPIRDRIQELKISWDSAGNLTNSQILTTDLIVGLDHSCALKALVPVGSQQHSDILRYLI